jgi:hypothetical protein
MGTAHRYIIAIACTIQTLLLSAQQPGFQDTPYTNTVFDVNPRYYSSHDTVWIYSGICKTLRVQMLTGNKALEYIAKQKAAHSRIPFLKAHGTVQYDFTYRSFVDTPFSQRDFAQHSVQASLDLLFRDKYPVRLVIGSRRSNSRYFDNITDVNLQFSNRAFLNNIKESIRKKIPLTVNTDRLTELENLYERKKWEVDQLQGWLNHPARMQQLIEEKEKAIAKAANKQASNPLDDKLNELKAKVGDKKDSLLDEKRLIDKDSLQEPDLMTQYEKKKSALQKSLQELNSLEQKIKGSKKAGQDSIAQLKKQLDQITDPSVLKEFVHEHHLDAKELPKGWQALSVINNLGIGRTWVDYSDLTVKNVSLTGINAELTPSRFYLAFAAGKVNYRFRDFVIKNNDRPRQSLYLLRAGIGKKEGNNFILTWYNGKKNLLNGFGSSMPTIANLERVLGVSAESRLQIDANNFVVLEAAKSSFHTAATINQGSEKLAQTLWNFKDRSNEAYSIKISSTWPASNTKVTGYFRKMGAHFQSFNLQPVNVNQDAYQLKVNQSFWKRRLVVEAGIRKNDFNNPFINPGLNSKTVFKSVQATLRVPKYPFVSVGYYPSSQITILDNNVAVENQYNTFNAIAGHAYRIGNIGMNTNAVFLKFYNSGADTGFIYYNASSWTLNHYVFLRIFQLQSGVTFTSQHDLRVVTLEQLVSCQLRQWLTISGGLKYNKVNRSDVLWGSTAGLGIIINKIGTIQASYDKSFLPGTSRNLLPVDMGKVSYYRTF